MSTVALSELAFDLLANLPDPVVIDDSRGKILYVNRAFEEMFGISGKQIEFYDFEDFTAPEHRGTLLNLHLRRMLNKEVPSSVSFTGIRVDGTRLFLQSTVSMFNEGGMTYFLTILKPSSEAAARSEFQQCISALELSMNVCSNLIHYMEKHSGAGSYTESGEIERLSGHLKSILCTVDHGEEVMADPGLIVLEAAGMISGMARSGVNVTYSVAPGIPEMKIHEKCLKNIIRKIADNSLESFESEGNIHLRIRVEKSSEAAAGYGEIPASTPMISIEIKDNGIGMSRAVLERACEPFYTTKDIRYHKGMGLFEVYRAVRFMNGTVRISSVENEGTHVRVLVPVS